MATTVLKPGDSKPASTALIATSDEPRKSPKHYRGFVAGVFSGIAKLSGTLPRYTGRFAEMMANKM
jgi:solute carrier family 25 carnitine/acylcarnitine transporter 20/29